jgi:preprotein translocase subunit SecD
LRQLATFVALVVLAVAAGYYSLDNKHFPVAQGLDLQGGMRVTLEPDRTKPDGEKATPALMDQVRDVIESRVNSFGLSGTEVRKKGDYQVLVLLPGAKNPEEALKVISKVAQLEFWYLPNIQSSRNANGRYMMTHGGGGTEKETYAFTDTRNDNKPVPLEEILKPPAELILKGADLKPECKANIDPSKGEPYVSFEFKPSGADAFGKFTTEHVGEILAIVLDKEIISAPNIDEPIPNGQGIIRGGFQTMVEARTLANLLNSGALPVPLRPAETQFVGATLGQDSIDRSIKAGVAGLGLVLVFMVAYYWLPGVLACLALLVYAAVTFWIFKGLPLYYDPKLHHAVTIGGPIVLDLPGITGFILSVGMAVDANILIFERLKEEMRAGKSLHAAVDAGFKRAFTAIFDSNVTTWIVCGIMIWLGAPVVRGFAVNLAIGVAVSMFTAITVTRTFLHLVMETPAGRNPALYGLNVSWLSLFFPAWKEGGVLHVFEKRRVYLGLTIALAVIALAFLAMTPFGYGLRPGIDFTGGTVIQAAFRDKNVTREQVETAVKTAGISDARIAIGRSEAPFSTVTVDLSKPTATDAGNIKEALATLPQFDATAYKEEKPKDALKVTAFYTTEVTEAQVRASFAKLQLKDPKIQVAQEQHGGANAIPVADIESRKLTAEQQAGLKTALSGIGGGIITPMYQENFIGPSVASQVTQSAFTSVLVASLAIILYLAFRFAIGGFMNGLKFGTCAVVALVHDVGIVIGMFALFGTLLNWQIDSLFVTAALTILGFSVHDTIVVYDRIRENLHHRQRGETFADVSNRSITQTFDRSINTSMTVVLVVSALVVFGGGSIRQFNTALLIGIVLGTYSSIFVAAPLVVMWERAAAARRGETAPAAAGAGRPRPQAPAAPRTPARATATPRTQPQGNGAGAAGDGVSPPGPVRPGTVKPTKRKRRM